MLTEIQYKNMCKRLAKIVVRREDWINIYPICSECFARIEYIPPIKKKEPVKIAVVWTADTLLFDLLIQIKSFAKNGIFRMLLNMSHLHIFQKTIGIE